MYKRAFPDFVLDVEIPDDWFDQSWKNDVCPKWSAVDDCSICIFIDYADDERREVRGYPRFMVCQYDHNDEPIESLNYASDDWADIVWCVDSLTNPNTFRR